MDVFIHEEYVNKHNEVREQRRKQMQTLHTLGNPGVSRAAPAPASQESPRSPGHCPAPTSGVLLSSARSSAAAAEKAASWDHRRLFDRLKPY